MASSQSNSIPIEWAHSTDTKGHGLYLSLNQVVLLKQLTNCL